MTIAVREVDLESEMDRLTDVFNRGFNAAIPRERFEWLYLRNPDGPATAWFVMDDRSGEIAGCTAVFPRRIQVRGHGQPVVAWNCGDFCIMPKYRAGAAAIKLRRAARDGIDAGARPFLYAHPNDRMLQIHLKVGHQPLGRMIRVARPTRLARSGVAGTLGNLALRAARPDRAWPLRDECETEKKSLPGAINELYDRMRRELGTSLVRDARYLTWRFLDCPLDEYEFVLARRGGRITGYLVYCVRNEQVHVKDWLGQDGRAIRTLFGAAIDRANAANALSASVTLLDTHRDLGRLRSMGFARRPETSTSVVYASEALPWRADVMSDTAWYMTVGDRDV